MVVDHCYFVLDVSHGFVLVVGCWSLPWHYRYHHRLYGRLAEEIVRVVSRNLEGEDGCEWMDVSGEREDVSGWM